MLLQLAEDVMDLVKSVRHERHVAVFLVLDPVVDSGAIYPEDDLANVDNFFCLLEDRLGQPAADYECLQLASRG
jgi:hypothetical protein